MIVARKEQTAVHGTPSHPVGPSDLPDPLLSLLWEQQQIQELLLLTGEHS